MDEIVKNALYGLEPTPPIPKGLKEPPEEPEAQVRTKILLWVIVILLIILVIMKMLGWI